MSSTNYPITPAVRVLREKHISFIPHLYTYEEHGGTRASAIALGVPEHQVIKTLVMENDARRSLLVLMHGDYEVSTKQLARHLGVKHIEPCTAVIAQKHTGYLFGGTSPFGTRTQLLVCVEKTIFDLKKIYINGGKRGFLVEIEPAALKTALNVVEVEVAIKSA